MKTWKWVLGASLAAVLAAACGDDSSGDDGDGDGTGTGTGTTGTGTMTGGTGTMSVTGMITSTGTPTGTPTMTVPTCDAELSEIVFDDAACNDCVVDECCEEAEDCGAGSDCENFVSCFNDCDGDDACQQACIADNAPGVSAFQAALDCSDAECAEECTPVTACGVETITFGSGVFAECVDNNCCATYVPCTADPECTTCLTTPTPDQGPECAANATYQAYVGCLDTSCPTDLCDSGIGFFTNEMPQQPVIECNVCVEANCDCADLNTCVGCVADDSCANAMAEQAAVDLCVACLQDPMAAACNDQAVEDAAVAYNACITAQCSMECM